MAAGKLAHDTWWTRHFRTFALCCAGIFWIFLVIGLFSQNEFQLFLFHPIFMFSGMCCYTHGVMAFRNPFFSKAGITHTNMREHAIVQGTGVCLMLIGFAIIVKVKTEFDVSIVPETNHGWMALITISLVVLQASSGIIKIWMMPLKPTGLKLHGPHGIFLYIFAIFTVSLGVWEMATFEIATLSLSFRIILYIFLFGLFVAAIIRRFFTSYPKTAENANMEEFMKTLFSDEEDSRSVIN